MLQAQIKMVKANLKTSFADVFVVLNPEKDQTQSQANTQKQENVDIAVPIMIETIQK